jgi:hypothetical protein
VYKFLWFNCVSGSDVAEENVIVAGGDQSWDKPNSIDGELAVYIKRIRG